jgi:PKD repeat protein
MAMRRPARWVGACVTVPSSRHSMLRLAVAATIGLALVLVAAPTALAQPTNDAFADAAIVPSFPFSASVDISQATIEPEEPIPCGVRQSVWYAITPVANAVLQADTNGSDFSNTALVLYRQDGSGLGGLSLRDCTTFGGRVVFGVEVGQTYYLQAGSESGFGDGSNLHLNISVYPPPPNDDFANATSISALPFVDSLPVDLTAATAEPDEPVPSCIFLPSRKTIWYVFTPTQSGSLTATMATSSFPSGIAAYTGGSLATLTEVGCDQFSRLTFQVNANTTYYFQVDGIQGTTGSLQFQLTETPHPVADFVVSPADPSIFDEVQFTNLSEDPGGKPVTLGWEFGDGTTAGDTCCPTHRYSADGDYTAQVTITTSDGRTATASHVVQVRTHDVAIVELDVPKKARVGTTIAINARVRNTRYPETVQVDLSKSGPGGFQQIDSLIQPVPVRPRNRTALFAFTYTITEADQSIGKVSFKAMATIIDHRDALPGDNEMISPPVKIS